MSGTTGTLQERHALSALKAQFDGIYSSGQDEDGGALTTANAASNTSCSASESGFLFDFVQWTSSFTMSQIPNRDMFRWVKCTMDRIVQNCDPANFLDIGCGSGLVLFASLARQKSIDEQDGKTPSSARTTEDETNTFSLGFYTGIDISEQCVRTLARRVHQCCTQERASKIRVFSAAAHEVDFGDPTWWRSKAEVGAGTLSSASCEKTLHLFDTVCINSVIVYFPSMAYLVGVLESFVPHICQPALAQPPTLGESSGITPPDDDSERSDDICRRRCGTIFCGDIRDSRLLRLFYLSIAIQRNPPGWNLFRAPPGELKTFDDAVAADAHLLQSPLDFIRMVADSPRLGSSVRHILIQPKLSPHAYAAAFVDFYQRVSLEKGVASRGHGEEGILSNRDAFFNCLDNEMTRYRFDVTLSIPTGDDDDLGNCCRAGKEGRGSVHVCKVEIVIREPAAPATAGGECRLPCKADSFRSSAGAASEVAVVAYPWVSELASMPFSEYQDETLNANKTTKRHSDGLSPAQRLHVEHLKFFLESDCLQHHHDPADAATAPSPPPPVARLFSYPHVPVLFDALIGESHVLAHSRPPVQCATPPAWLHWFDDEGGEDDDDYNSAASRYHAVLAATMLLTPLQLISWFHRTPAFSHLCLELTLHPTDPTKLIGIICPKGIFLQVMYALILEEKDTATSAAAEGTKAAAVALITPPLVPRSSQPRGNVKQSHFFNELDLLDQWVATAACNQQHEVSLFPAPISSIGGMIWGSLTSMLSLEDTAKRTCLGHFTPTLDDPTHRQSLSWKELAERVGRFAFILTSRFRVVPGDFVIQFVDRSIDQIIGLLAILSVGAVYVPLAASPNPDPPARIAKVIEDCSPKVLLTQQGALEEHLMEALVLAKMNIPITTASVVSLPSSSEEAPAVDVETISKKLLHASDSTTADAPAYCIYTSGSTSKPKAVVLTHRNFHNLLCAFHFGTTASSPVHESLCGDSLPSITSYDMRMLQTTAASFDLHVYECLAPLLLPFLTKEPHAAAGDTATSTPALSAVSSQLILLSDLDLEAYVAAVSAAEVTHIVCTPTYLASIAEHCDLFDCWEKLKSVRLWRTGGEGLKQSVVNAVLPKLQAVNRSVKMWCSYGPAECTDTATMSLCRVSEPNSEINKFQLVRIGKPLQNYFINIFVETEDLCEEQGTSRPAESRRSIHLARPGEVGMIYISGPSVFGGYYKREDLTATALTPISMARQENKSSAPFYRTGDLGKYVINSVTSSSSFSDAGGVDFCFVGRCDFAQVKIRGQRIETTEIESVLASHHRIAHVIVTKFSRSDEDYLAAYYSLHPRQHCDQNIDNIEDDASTMCAELHTLCLTSFPTFMIPASFNHVALFLTNRNGKVDRNLLPPPVMHQPSSHPSQKTAPLSKNILSSHHGEDASRECGSDTSCDDRLVWLRLLMLRCWVDIFPSVSIGKSLPSNFSASAFSDSWMAMGASSLTLMRYISQLKFFILDQWLDGGRTTKREDGIAVSGIVVPEPPVPPQLSRESRQHLVHLLSFPQIFKHRCINGVSRAVFKVIFPEAARNTDDGVSSVGSSLSPITKLQALPPTSVTAVASDSSFREVFLRPFLYWLRWMCIMWAAAIFREMAWRRRQASSLLGAASPLLPSSSRLLGAAGPLMWQAAATQQQCMAADEVARYKNYEGILDGATPHVDQRMGEDGESSSRPTSADSSCTLLTRPLPVYNCPYVLRLTPTTSAAKPCPNAVFTLGAAKAVAKTMENMLTHIVHQQASLRCTNFTLDCDRYTQRCFDLTHPDHRQDCNVRPHFIFAASTAESKTPPSIGGHFFDFTSEVQGTTMLAAAVRAAAGERIEPRQCKALFRFHVFYEVPKTEALKAYRSSRTAVGSPTDDEILQSLASSADGASDGLPVVSLHFMLNFHHLIFDGESVHQLLVHLKTLAHSNTMVPSPSLDKKICEASGSGAYYYPLCVEPSPSGHSAVCREYFAYCAASDRGHQWTRRRESVMYWMNHLTGWDPAVVSETMPRTRTPVDGVWPKKVTTTTTSSSRTQADCIFTAVAGKVRHFVSPETAALIQQFSVVHHVTPFTVFLSCFYTAMYANKLVKQKTANNGSSSSSSSSKIGSASVVDICVGSAMSNRNHHPSLATSLCLLADPYPFRLQFSPHTAKASNILSGVSDLLHGHMTHSATVLGTIFVATAVELGKTSVTPQRSPVVNPFFAAVMLFEDRQLSQVVHNVPMVALPRSTPRPYVSSPSDLQAAHKEGQQGAGGDDRHAAFETEGVDLALLDLPTVGSLFEVQLKVQELPSVSTHPYALSWEFPTQVYTRQAIEDMAIRFDALLLGMLRNSEQTVDQLCASVLHSPTYFSGSGFTED